MSCLWKLSEIKFAIKKNVYTIGVQSSVHFGRGTGPVLLDQLQCSGSEQNLLNCSHRGEGVTASYCRYYDRAGVRCSGAWTSIYAD